MLRAFISWVKIEVMAGNSYVETNVSAIFVPSGVTLPEEHHTETTATISFYGHTLKATTSNSCCEFEKWLFDIVENSGRTYYFYVAYAKQIVRNLYFTTNSNCSLEYIIDSADAVTVSPPYYYVEVFCGTYYTLTYKNYDKDGCYSECQISFTNTSGERVKIIYKTTSTKYYISNFVFNNDYQSAPTNNKICDNYGNARVVVAEKTYNTEFV